MWNQIVAAFAILIALTYVIEKIFYRNKPRTAPRRVEWGREIAVLLIFAGIFLIILSFIEAQRRAIIEPWLWGGAFGILIGLIALAGGLFQIRFSARGAFSLLRAYGVALILGLIGIAIVIRVSGAAAQVFIESAMSVFILGAAGALWLRGRPQNPSEGKQ